MLKLDLDRRELTAADVGTLSAEAIAERTDLQEIITRSWDAFVGELGMPELRFISSEVVPHHSCANRIDILAFDAEDGRPVVIELKRDHNRLQLLQALSYAGMLSTWTTNRFLEELGDSDDEDLRNSIQNRESGLSPTVILLAEQYDPEVILTSAWLGSDHNVPIYCFSIKLFRLGDDLHLLIQRDFPLRGLDETYVARRAAPLQAATSQSWEDVKSWINFEWGRDAIDEMLENASGNASKRYFPTPVQGSWGGYMLYVNRNELRVRFHTRRPGDVEYWSERLEGAAVTTWGSSDTAQGISISLPAREDFDAFKGGLSELPPEDEEPDASG